MTTSDTVTRAGETSRYGRERVLARQIRRRELLDPRLATVTGTTYMMGSEKQARMVYCGETPSHEVTISSFSIMRTCVTNELYGHYAPDHVVGLDPQLPVVNVTWFQAAMFCDWIGGRLPTEAEWEAACRIDCPDVPDDLEATAWFSHNSGDRVHAVGTRLPNSAGICDLLGNVWEWCYDTYDSTYYQTSPQVDPVNATAHGNRVCRGGAMNSFFDMCRPAYRHHEPADYWSADIGFRVAADLHPRVERQHLR